MGIISLGKVENQKYLSCHHVDPLGSMEMVQYIYPHEWLKIIMGSMYLWDVQKFEKIELQICWTNIYFKMVPPNLAGFFMVLYTMGSNRFKDSPKKQIRGFQG